MFSYIWPLALVVISNILYHICAKSQPDSLHPLASLTVTYAVAAIFSAVLYFLLRKEGNLWQELRHLNWTAFVLGLVIVGLEAGFLFAYRAGWQVSTASIVQSAFLSIALVIVGVLLFKEGLSWNKIIGVSICLVGLVFINL